MNMEVITIESVAYQQLMGRIESIVSHIERLEATRSVQGIPDTLLNTREAAEILHISTRTLQRLRSEKRIDFVILRGKYLYSAREVGRIIDEGRLKGDPATIEELRHHFNLRTGKVSPKWLHMRNRDYDTRLLEMMRDISEHLNRQDKELELIVHKIDEELHASHQEECEHLLDNQDLCDLLHVSKRTLQRYRTSKMIPYFQLKHKIYYKLHDVHDFIEKYIKPSGRKLPDTMEQFKVNKDLWWMIE